MHCVHTNSHVLRKVNNASTVNTVCLQCAKCSLLRFLFILLQETIQRPFENDDSLEQKKQQMTEKSSATTPTGQCTGKNLPELKVTIICTSTDGTVDGKSRLV
jgi:hypothetical protein